MTVSFLFGWQGLVTLLVLVIAVGLVFLLISAVRTTRDTQAEWQEYLGARSRTAGRDPERADAPMARGGEPASGRAPAAPPGPRSRERLPQRP
jgi:hypothetical protein